MLWVDDAHHLDAASLTLLRRLAWASRDLPLVLLVSTRPYPSREPLAMLVQQAQVHLRLPPMGPMMTERLVYDHTGRWPGPVLRRVLDLAAGNPLFATELLGTYERAGALAEAGPDSVDARFELDLRATAARHGPADRDRRLHAEVQQELPGSHHSGRGRRARRVVTVRSRRGRLRPRWQASDTESPDDLAAAFDAYANAVIPALSRPLDLAPTPIPLPPPPPLRAKNGSMAHWAG